MMGDDDGDGDDGGDGDDCDANGSGGKQSTRQKQQYRSGQVIRRSPAARHARVVRVRERYVGAVVVHALVVRRHGLFLDLKIIHDPPTNPRIDRK